MRGPAGITRLRRLTWWTMVGCLVLVAVLVVWESTKLGAESAESAGPGAGSGAPGTPSRGLGTGPGGFWVDAGGHSTPLALLVALVAVVIVCVVAGRLFAVAVLGARRPAAIVTTTVLAVAGLAGAGLLVLSRAAGSGGFPWTLPLAVLLAAVWTGVDRAGAAGPAGWTDADRMGAEGLTVRTDVDRARAGAGAAAAREPAVDRRAWRLAGPAGVVLALGASAAGSWSAGASVVSPALVDAAMVTLCAAAAYAQIWILWVAERLDQARRLEREVAITDERLRFAADLHDIQGHSLQVIALKSELAERLADADPARAAAEMRDVQALARQALGDTREVVQGYRSVSLDTEIGNATRVLSAAGIETSLTRPAELPRLTSTVEQLLGLMVRECTTNVLRHSAARRCDVALTVDNGAVLLRFVNDAPLELPAAPPGGLATLADRLSAAGGHLVTEGTPECFTVTACLPSSAAR
jgi:two-component system sensor histidine kinase DesK